MSSGQIVALNAAVTLSVLGVIAFCILVYRIAGKKEGTYFIAFLVGGCLTAIAFGMLWQYGIEGRL